MIVSVLPDASQIARCAADLVVDGLAKRPAPILGVATGSSPRGLYAELAARVADGRLTVDGLQTFSLDEYLDLPEGHPASYRREILEQLARRIGLTEERVHSPRATPDSDPYRAAEDYEEDLRAVGGVDVQILGVGSNGHIAFNEPGSDPACRTHVQALTERTRQDNSRFFGGRPDLVPTRALTQGLGTILEARRIVLIATGAGKAEAIAHLVDGPVDPTWPVSVLKDHPDVTILLDEAATTHLRRTGRRD